MSKAYTDSIRIAAGATAPPGMSKQVWLRHRRIAADTRLAAMDSALLPDSYSSLCELTRMPSGLIAALAGNGLLGQGVSSRVLREVRIRGKLPIRIEGWVKPEEYAEVSAYVGVYT